VRYIDIITVLNRRTNLARGILISLRRRNDTMNSITETDKGTKKGKGCKGFMLPFCDLSATRLTICDPAVPMIFN